MKCPRGSTCIYRRRSRLRVAVVAFTSHHRCGSSRHHRDRHHTSYAHTHTTTQNIQISFTHPYFLTSHCHYPFSGIVDTYTRAFRYVYIVVASLVHYFYFFSLFSDYFFFFLIKILALDYERL